MYDHVRTVLFCLIILASTTACIIGGIPFRIENQPDGTTKAIQPDANCELGNQTQVAVTGLENLFRSEDCISRICAIPKYQDTQFCGLLTGETDPLDLEITFTVHSLDQLTKGFNQSFNNR